MSNLFGDDWVYETNKDNTARFILGELGTSPLICIGVNPSTATPDKLDNTLRRVKGFSKSLGYDGWIMLNLYPQRATNPDDLHKEINMFLAMENKEIIEYHFQAINFTIWAAWGKLIEKRPYLKECLENICRHFEQDRWITVGDLTKDGHPRHPLYLPKNSEVRDFDVNEYLKKLK